MFEEDGHLLGPVDALDLEFLDQNRGGDDGCRDALAVEPGDRGGKQPVSIRCQEAVVDVLIFTAGHDVPQALSLDANNGSRHR